ncbi:hypothetical protein JCM10212_003050 [Sporobolomyces blumeae]
MLPRTPEPLKVELPPATGPPAFPGLVSALRPLKRLSAQLRDESALLHRFTYKNKNQHKAATWWRKVVEADRVMSRTLGEVDTLLAHFGSEKESDEANSIQAGAIVVGVLQLPRSMVLVEKTIDVLLGCASILEQVIDSRAFLSFAVIIVSLVARLHSLSAVLYDELDRLAGVLRLLVETNKLSSTVDPLVAKMPRDLRKYIKPTSFGASLQAGPSAMPRTEPEQATSIGGDDTGAVVTRRPAQTKPKEKKVPTSVKATVAPPTTAPPAPIKRPRTERDDDSGVVPLPPSRKKHVRPDPGSRSQQQPRTASSPVGLFPFTFDAETTTELAQPAKTKAKRSRADEASQRARKETDNEAGEKVVKKKKKVRQSTSDEIDAIFG